MTHVLVLAPTSRRHQILRADIDFALESGHEVVLVTLKAKDWQPLDPRVRLIEFGPVEVTHPLLRLRKLLFRQLPDAPLYAAERTLRALLRAMPARLRTKVRRAADRVGRARRAQDVRARRFQERHVDRYYKALRPHVLWQLTAQTVLRHRLHVGAAQVVAGEALALPALWWLRRRVRQLPARLELDRDALTGM